MGLRWIAELFWIPAFAGMTVGKSEMTTGGAIIVRRPFRVQDMAGLDVEVLDLEGVGLDEVAARGYDVAH